MDTNLNNQNRKRPQNNQKKFSNNSINTNNLSNKIENNNSKRRFHAKNSKNHLQLTTHQKTNHQSTSNVVENSHNKKNIFNPQTPANNLKHTNKNISINKKFFHKPIETIKKPNLSNFNQNDVVIAHHNHNVSIAGIVSDNSFLNQITHHPEYAQNCNIPTKIFALGGIEEIGKNMYCIQHDNEIIIIDCGIKFANKRELPGVSGIIPSFSYLKENEDKIKCLIITHGHEDHIGGVPYLLKTVKVPVVYAPTIAAEMIKRKVNEHTDAKLHELKVFADDSVFRTQNFHIDFYRVNHSIPDSYGVAVITPNGVIASSGDFRFDFANETEKTNLNKVAEIATRNVDVLLCESTNAENPGFNESEEKVLKELFNIIAAANGRVLLTSFASNLGRVEEVVRMGVQLNRKIVIIGRSMTENIEASMRVGYLKVNDDFIIKPRRINEFPDNEILILCTGSQGEENAALSNIANSRHAWVHLKPTDTVILSSNAIPGNFVSVNRVVNQLSKSGAKVLINSPHLRIHASGHAAQLEQQLLMNIFRPQHLIPIHGEYKMLRALKNSSVQVGVNKDNIHIIRNGQVLHLHNRKIYDPDEFIDASEVYIDAQDTIMGKEGVIQERHNLSENGIIIVQIFLDTKEKKINSITPLSVAGCFFILESIDLLKQINYQIKNNIEKYLTTKNIIKLRELKHMIQKIIGIYVWKFKKIKPEIIVEITDASIKKLLGENANNNKKIKAHQRNYKIKKTSLSNENKKQPETSNV